MMVRSVIALVLAAVLAACGPSEPKTEGAAPVMRRLSEAQYRQIVADVFGDHIVIAGALDPLSREEGLMAIGAGMSAVTPAAFERFDNLARSIATQVTDQRNRATLVGCSPADARAADEACARSFFARTGRLLFRRSLTDRELNAHVAAAGAAAGQLNDFYAGLAQSLAGMMVAPAFLYVADTTEPDPDQQGRQRLTAYAKASRLSFLLWNTAPDEALLVAAEKGDLHTKSGLAKQVDRMLASPRAEAGVRAFFADMLAFERFETLEKDPQIYPTFSPEAGADAREQVLRTLVDHLLVKEQDYRKLFTTRETFMSQALGRVYQVPVEDPNGWVRYTFDDGDHRAGLQTLVGFSALYSHPGRSSPTLRGKAVRELLMCQRIPDPPADVDFSQFNDPKGPGKTARERLDVHNSTPSCAGCHKLMDPLGLAMEHFDGAGQFRTAENGVTLDTAGELDGVAFTDASELGEALSKNPAVTSCLVNRAYGYAAGRPLARSDAPFLEYLGAAFADEGYRFRALLRTIATSDAYYAITPPKSAPQKGKTVAGGPQAKENGS
jgi:hypothetical protein